MARKFAKGQIVKSDANYNTSYKVTVLHRNGDMTITVEKPVHMRGINYRIAHGNFDRFSLVN